MTRKFGLVVPVLKNFKGFAELMTTVRAPIFPVIVPNWINNIGVGIAWNIGVKLCLENDCTHILISNDDIILSKNIFTHLADRLDVNDNCLMSTGRNTRLGTEIDHKKQPPMEEIWNRFQTYVDAPPNEGDAPDFSCFMVSPRTIVEVGWFDPGFAPAYFEDNDYHRRIHLAGGITASLSKAPIFHRGSVTQNMDTPVVTGDMFQKNRQYYIRKWGGGPGQETFIHPFNDPSRDWRWTSPNPHGGLNG